MMRRFDRIPYWLLITAASIAFAGWMNIRRAERVMHVTALAREVPTQETTSITGYREGTREIIAPERSTESYDWITQTQHLLSAGGFRVEKISWENAPQGRDNFSSALYAWWLAACSKVAAWKTGVAEGAAVETAALWCEPVLQGLTILVVAILGFLGAGQLGASFSAIACALLYPLGVAYLPGVPGHHGMAALLGAVTVLAIITVLLRRGSAEGKAWLLWLMVLSGASLGLLTWLSPAIAFPVQCAVAVAAIFAAVVRRFGAQSAENEISWRAWGLAAAATSFFGVLITLFPGRMGEWELRSIHPAYSLFLVGLGEILGRTFGALERRRRWALANLGDIALLIVTCAAVLSLPIAMHFSESRGMLQPELGFVRLTTLPNGIAAPGFGAWWKASQASWIMAATLLPLVVALAAVGASLSKKIPAPARVASVFAGAATIVVSAFAFFHLRLWQLVDAMTLGAVVSGAVVITKADTRIIRLGTLALLLAVVGFSSTQVWTSVLKKDSLALTLPEAEALIERDLSHWLVRRSGEEKPITLAPPTLTTPLSFFGGTHGIGTFAWENSEGFSAALRIMIANTFDEAKALIDARRINYLVLPSWDLFFQHYADSEKASSHDWLISNLSRWNLPLWLRPIAYQTPMIGGLDPHSVVVLQVVEEQDEALAASRATEYFIEMGKPDHATNTGVQLQRFPGDVNASVALCHLALAARNRAEFDRAFSSLKNRLETGAARFLPIDRRLSLAVVLARGGDSPAARAQLEQVLRELTVESAREIPTANLYHLHVLATSFKVPFANASAREETLRLIPPELRSRL